MTMVGAVSAVTAGAAEPNFRDVAATAGVDFVHENGASGEKYAVELIGAGAALLDYDGDGDLDLYFVQGGKLPGGPEGDPRNVLFERVGEPPANAGQLQYRRVPDAAGADDPSYGMGVAVGDIDNDGDSDLFVTNFGENRLYRNDAGTFTDITAAAGVGDERWSASAVFFDADADGWLDLYVANYFRYRLEEHEWYGLRKDGYRTHGGPASFRPEADIFYRNRGDGTFANATADFGFAAVADAHALGVIAGDYDDDGDVDLYVANDTQPNWLFVNDGQGGFIEDGMLAGVSFDQAGAPQAGMGVDAQDASGDGVIDLFVTNFSHEANTYYQGEAGGFFADRSYAAGLGEPALPHLGFGVGFFDFDLDADLDVFVANGHIMDNVSLYFDDLAYAQPNQLFVNDGAGHFAPATSAGDAIGPEAVSRAVVFGDLDDDGDPDVVVTNVAASPQVLRNDGATGGFVRVQLRGRQSNRDGFGAEVRLHAGGVTQRRQVRSAFSYLAANDARPLFGLADATEADWVEVRWPSGVVDRIEAVPAGRTVFVIEGAEPRLLPEGVASWGFSSAWD